MWCRSRSTSHMTTSRDKRKTLLLLLFTTKGEGENNALWRQLRHRGNDGRLFSGTFTLAHMPVMPVIHFDNDWLLWHTSWLTRFIIFLFWTDGAIYMYWENSLKPKCNRTTCRGKCKLCIDQINLKGKNDFARKKKEMSLH